jgi:hypothetical protein
VGDVLLVSGTLGITAQPSLTCAKLGWMANWSATARLTPLIQTLRDIPGVLRDATVAA